MFQSQSVIVDDSSRDGDIEEDVHKPEVPTRTSQIKPNRAATVKWFQKTQTEKVVNRENGIVADWFHGIISRR